jgi:hypothetical protein
MTFGTSMLRPKVPTSFTKPMNVLERAATVAIGGLYVHGLTKICMSVLVCSSMRWEEVLVLMVVVVATAAAVVVVVMVDTLCGQV